MSNPDRNLPINELDLQMQLTESLWGEQLKNDNLGGVLQDIEVNYPAGTIILKNNGEKAVLGESIRIRSDLAAWSLLAYLTRDLRLGNLTNSEINDSQHFLDLAGDCLQEGYIRSFSASIKRVAHILELSQSRNGFFRKILNTLRREEFKTEMNPPKRGLFGGYKKAENPGGGY